MDRFRRIEEIGVLLSRSRGNLKKVQEETARFQKDIERLEKELRSLVDNPQKVVEQETASTPPVVPLIPLTQSEYENGFIGERIQMLLGRNPNREFTAAEIVRIFNEPPKNIPSIRAFLYQLATKGTILKTTKRGVFKARKISGT